MSCNQHLLPLPGASTRSKIINLCKRKLKLVRTSPASHLHKPQNAYSLLVAQTLAVLCYSRRSVVVGIFPRIPPCRSLPRLRRNSIYFGLWLEEYGQLPARSFVHRVLSKCKV
ncbi:hypothetical protein BD311DRAFT_767320 [Dichomitus squalens]|uniref:Uncharacterized protein n=1 Tax=Dichomitus squalens TaxID=114155 RepID=A0A4Q9MA32_9APHY|nr:hypothetical protein BD311DRAFT_767320 [Dichomitus squalens]